MERESKNNSGESAQEDMTGAALEMKGKYLTFFTEQQLYGVPIADVVQIIGIQTITQVPEFPSYAKGIINLRGSIIPVIDIRLRLGKMERDYDERTCIIVTSIADRLIGFIVDSVDEVTDIGEDEISPPPKLSGDQTSAFLTGIGKQEKRVVLLLDSQRLLGQDDFSWMSAI